MKGSGLDLIIFLLALQGWQAERLVLLVAQFESFYKGCVTAS